MSRTITKHLNKFTRPSPSAVIYDLSQPHVATITLPVGSGWTSGLHWHERHAEYLLIKQGRALITLGVQTREYGVNDGIIEIKQGILHEWRRIPSIVPMKQGQGSNTATAAVKGDEEDDLIVQEWTEPRDGEKEIFFRMLNSCLTEKHLQPYSGNFPIISTPICRFSRIPIFRDWVVQLQLFIIFRACDNWPVLLSDQYGRWINWWVTHTVLWFSWILGASVLGMKAQYDEYLPRGGHKRSNRIQQ